MTMQANTDRSLLINESSLWRPKWFLVTRFLAVAGVVAVLVLSRFVFSIDTINYRALWFLAGVLFTTNIVYVVYYRSGHLHDVEKQTIILRRHARFTTIQINLDLLILTFMLHFSGGATNPFIFYYFFHVVLSSILLTKRAAYIEATVAATLFSVLTALEGFGVVAHHDLFCPGFYTMPMFIVGMAFAVSSALYIAVYMTTSIMDRLHEHQEELERTLEEIRRLEKEKSQFLDVVAHDLKSPLAAIETMVSSALAVHRDNLPPEIRTVLERIPARTQSLLHFTQDLLEFSRIKSLDEIRDDFRKLNPLPIVTATVEMYINQAESKKIAVSVQSKGSIPPVLGSQKHLEHMVGNLVSNAIRYTPDGGSITVKVESDGNTVSLLVADTGIGIPENALGRIFDEFYRAENAKKFNTAGTGLGMSITKAIVEKHGGTISVKSQEGEGTVFTVRLPALRE